MPIRRRLIAITLWLTAVLAAFVSLHGTAIHHDLTQFMPKGASVEQQRAVALLREGPASRLIMIGLHGADTVELARISRALSARLLESDLFAQVANGAPHGSALPDVLFRYRYILTDQQTTEAFNPETLRMAFKQRLRELSSPLGLLDRHQLGADPTAAARRVIESWRPQDQPHRQEGVWFSPKGDRALLLAVTRDSGFDAEAQEAIIDTIRHAYHDTKPPAGVALELSGSPVFASSARATIRADLQLLTGVGSVLIVLLLWFTYRSLWLVLLGALPLLSALLIGGMATVIGFGSLHGITLVFGMTLLGVAFDYPVHLFSHLRTAGSAERAIRHLWPTIRLGVITTCIGYLAFVRSDFQGLAQLGVFIIFGLAAAALTTRWLLPALLPAGMIPRTPRLPLAGLFTISNRNARLLLGSAALLCIALLLYAPTAWEDDLGALSPISAEDRRRDAQLRSDIGAAELSQMIVTEGADIAQVLERSERIAAQLDAAINRKLLTSYDYAARYLPSPATQRHRQKALPEPEQMQTRLDQALQGLPFKPHSFNAFLDDLEMSRTLPPLELRDLRGSPIESRIEPLLYRNQDGWLAVLTLHGIFDLPAFREWWAAETDGTGQFLDLKALSASTLIDFRDSTLDRLAIGLAAIGLSLWIGLRSLRRATFILLPILLAATLCVALLGAMGERLSLFHLIALLLTVGIGIDYSLFFQRSQRVPADHGPNLLALLVCALSTLTVFGILAISPIPVLRSIGLTVAIGVPLCFVLALAASRGINGRDRTAHDD